MITCEIIYSPEFRQTLKEKLLKEQIEKPLLSKKSKFFYHTSVGLHRFQRIFKNRLQQHALQKSDLLPSILARHQSLLYKKLGENNEHLQRQKVTNLRIAASKINQIIIQPGQTFSYWHAVGKPSENNGYVKGMLLARGKVVEGTGGGLCQLSNLLYWLFLHAPCEILERYHHSYDVFPDSGRVLPFASGATVFYNYVDLVARNISDQPLQIQLWLTDEHLKGRILSTQPAAMKYKVREENHCFISFRKQFFRYNELYRDELKEGKLLTSRLITKNFAPVLYPVTVETLRRKGYKVLELEDVQSSF